MRTKHVFKTGEVAHIWAQQKQDQGWNPQKNLFFEGKSIYSYGHHFEAARFIKGDVVFRTSRSYSVTTAKHLRFISWAVKNKILFIVPTFEDHKKNLDYLIQKTTDKINETNKAIKHIDIRVNGIENLLGDVTSYHHIFHKKITNGLARVKHLQDYYSKILSPLRLDFLRKRDMEIKSKERIRRATKSEREMKEQKENLELWKKGGLAGFYSFHRLPVVLRIIGDTVETSHGARIPLLAARELWDKLQNKEPLHGLQLGEYTVTSFDSLTLTVGCHEISIKEIFRLAKNLNWLKEEVTI